MNKLLKYISIILLFFSCEEKIKKKKIFLQLKAVPNRIPMKL